jgi:hypothetical protein
VLAVLENLITYVLVVKIIITSLLVWEHVHKVAEMDFMHHQITPVWHAILHAKHVVTI